MTDDTSTPPPLAGRTALVTGAGSGFGRAISQRFALDGARVGLAELSAEAAEATRDLIEAEGGEALVIPTDVTNYAAMQAAVQAVTDRWGRLDIMVNNAGITIREAFLDLTVDAFDKVMAANLTGVFHGVRAAGLQMKDQGGGVIINMSSIRANVGGFIHTSYCASKGGVRMLTKAAAVELGPVRRARLRHRARGCRNAAHRVAPCQPGGAGRSTLTRSHGTPGPAGGHLGGRGVPGVRRRGLRHRRHAVRGRRGDDALMPPVAIVTGAAHGIGRACVERLAADGYRVVASDVDGDDLSSLGRPGRPPGLR